MHLPTAWTFHMSHLVTDPPKTNGIDNDDILNDYFKSS